MLRRLALVPLAFAAIVAWVVPAASAVEQNSAVHIRQVDTNAFPSVAVTVSGEGSVDPQSVGVLENGKQMKILTTRALSQTGQNFDVVLSIDTSDSVAGAPLQAAVNAARAFVQKLPASVPVGLLTFDSAVKVLQPITADHGKVLSAIGTLGATQHGTLLYDSVPVAAQMFSGDAQHNVVLLTDGSDIGSTSTRNQAINTAQNKHVSLFTVGLGSQADAQVLRRMASETGGAYVPAAQSDLSAIYQGLAQELSNQFVLVYQSPSPGGVQITVSVEAGSATDQSIVLLPKLASPAPSGGGIDSWALHGNLALLLIMLGFFIGIFLIASLVWREVQISQRRKVLARRMAAPQWNQPPQAEGTVEAERTGSTLVPQALADTAAAWAGGSVTESLEQRLERAGIPITPGEFLVGTAAAVFVGLIIGAVLQSWIWALILAMVAGVIPYTVLRRKESKRIERLHEQLPDVLMILASSLRAGHSFLQALDTASKEIGDPSGPEFSRVVTEIRLGRNPHEALTSMAERIGTEEFKWAMLGINVQREVGGNLAEILDILAETVRDRDAVRRQVRVLSAEARLSMKIMIALPPLMVLYMIAVNGDYMKTLWTTRAGWIMIAAGCTLMAMGVVMMRRLVKVDV